MGAGNSGGSPWDCSSPVHGRNGKALQQMDGVVFAQRQTARQNDLDPNYLPSSLVNSLCDPVLVVVHGYNNRESDAFGLYADLAGLGKKKQALAHYGFTGTVIGFDWPTGYLNSMNPSAQLGLYASDLNQAKTNGVPAFSLFLDRLTNALIGRSVRVNVMAHSMGNFVMTRALMGNPAVAGR